MNRTAITLAAALGGFVGYWVIRIASRGTVHAEIKVSKDMNGNLTSTTDPQTIHVRKLQHLKWHVEDDGVLGEDETLQIVFNDIKSPLFGGHPKAKREGAKLKIRDVPHLLAKEFPFTYKYDVVHIKGGVPQGTIEDPEIQIEHI